jgi:hypothetical protein
MQLSVPFFFGPFLGLLLEDLFGGGSEHVIVSGGCEKAFLDQFQLAKSLFWLFLNSGENWCSW